MLALILAALVNCSAAVPFHGWCWDLPTGPPDPAVAHHGDIVANYERWSYDPLKWPDCYKLVLAGDVTVYEDIDLQAMLENNRLVFFQITSLYESGVEAISHGEVVPCPLEFCSP